MDMRVKAACSVRGVQCSNSTRDSGSSLNCGGRSATTSSLAWLQCCITRISARSIAYRKGKLPLVPVQPSVDRGGDYGDVVVPTGKLVGQEIVAAHHQVTGPGQIARAVAAGVEPHGVIDVQDHGMLRHGLERCESGQQL